MEDFFIQKRLWYLHRFKVNNSSVVHCWFIPRHFKWVSGHPSRFELLRQFVYSPHTHAHTAPRVLRGVKSPKRELQTKDSRFLRLPPPSRGSARRTRGSWLGEGLPLLETRRPRTEGGRGRARLPPLPWKFAATYRRGRAVQRKAAQSRAGPRKAAQRSLFPSPGPRLPTEPLPARPRVGPVLNQSFAKTHFVSTKQGISSPHKKVGVRGIRN